MQIYRYTFICKLILTSFSEYKDLATISNNIRVSAWNSNFSEKLKIMYC